VSDAIPKDIRRYKKYWIGSAYNINVTDLAAS